MKRYYYLILSLILLQLRTGLPVCAQDRVTPEEFIKDKISSFSGYLSPRKTYLQINKNQYSAGDVIWFKAYLLDGIHHLPDTGRTNLYVDLVNSQGVLMERRIILAEKGFAEGDINLPGDLPDGNYKIMAYTDWMRNFGEEFYFNRYIYIQNRRYADIIPRSEVRSSRRFNRDLERMADQNRIAFFPEGGHMVEGVDGIVAFKAFDGLGKGIDARGEILNQRSEVVARFSTDHAGIGRLELKPEPGDLYTARVSFNDSRANNFRLPDALKAGTSLRVEQDDENILVNIVSTHSPGDLLFTDKITVIAHTRGSIVHGESLPLQDGKAGLAIAKDRFPSGIAHLTVFSEDLLPLAERLVFIYHDDALIFYPEVTRQRVGDREYYVLNVHVQGNEGNPVEGSFSMSVTAHETGMYSMDENIISRMLLTSDISGIVGEPSGYLHPDKDLTVALDNLMMTHGWRKFTWENVLSGEPPEMEYLPSSALAITGRMIDPSGNRILSNFPVKLEFLSSEQNGDYNTNTEINGVFTFENLIFHDNVRIGISTDRLVNNHPPKIAIETGRTEGFDYVPNIYTLSHLITDRGDDWQRVPGAGRSPYARVEDEVAAAQQYGVPDQTLYIDPDIDVRDMYDILITRVRGLNHNLEFRGPTSITLSSTPLYMFDGVETSQAAFLALDPRYVERIEVFRGPRASVFGVRGASGAILGYTRRAGDKGIAGFKEFLVQGYHSPREFYSDVVSFRPVTDTVLEGERSVHWEPNLVTGEDGNFVTTVPVLSRPGTLTFVIEGVGLQDGPGYGVFSLTPSSD